MGYSIFCGVLTGTLIFLYKLAADGLVHLSRQLYAEAKGSVITVCAAFAVLILLAFAVALLHRKIPACRGGGIPASEGILRGLLSFQWHKTLIGVIIGSFIGFLCGIPLGSEGPSVLIGTCIGAFCVGIFKNRSAWSRYVMTGGAGAGFAVATGAPLSAILFALEEIHKRFTPMLVLTVSMSVVSATYVNYALCSLAGISPALFEIEPLAKFELSHVGYLLLFGVLLALAVGAFDALVALISKLTKKGRRLFTKTTKLIITFSVTGLLGLCWSDALYSGHDVIHHLLIENKTALFLFALLLARFFMMLLVTDSSVTGGVFIPTLAIGALASSLLAKLLVLCGMPIELVSPIVLLGMCAFIGGTLRAPLTAAVLFVELTGQFTNLFYVALVIFTVNFITELINQKPFYDRVLEGMEEEQNQGKTPKIVCFEVQVSHGAFVVGKAVRDVMWPSSTVVISITRAEKQEQDMDHDGEKKLYVGDTVVLRSRCYNEQEVIQHLRDLVGTDHEIRTVDPN